MTPASDPLTTVLDDLHRLADPGRRKAVEELRERAARGRLRVLVAGEAKRGKSTLINSLIGRNLLPAGVVPLTAIETTLRFRSAGDEFVSVAYIDGRTEERSVTDLSALVTERGNPGNAMGVRSVTATVTSSVFGRLPLELVDTPGTGSVYEHNTAAARASYETMDAVIVVLSADPPITAAERALLTDLAGRAVTTFVVLNKIDQLRAGDREEALEFTRSVLIGAGVDAQLFSLSATGRDAGFHRFASAFENYVRRRADIDLAKALRLHARRIALSIRAETELAARSLELHDDTGRAQLAEFARRLAALQRQAHDLADRLAATRRRLRRELDTRAAETHEELVRACRADIETFLEGTTNHFDAARVEEAGRDRIAVRVRDAISNWREQEARLLTDGLADAVDRVENERRSQLEQLRRNASELLTIDLDLPPGDIELSAGRGFWFAFADPPAWELPGTELLRHRGFGASKRAGRRVREAVDPLVDKQVGRARADLQQRLDETVRTVATRLHREHDQLLDGLARSMNDATTMHAATAETLAGQRAKLNAQLAGVGGLLAELDADEDHRRVDHCQWPG
jgi:GTP-binding protein EngB required for normal cell division